MSLFRQLSSSHPAWVVLPNNSFVSLFRVLVDLCNNLYVHLIITILSSVGALLFSLYEPSFPYKPFALGVKLFMPFFSIINIYACIWQTETYKNKLQRTVTISESESGSSYCNPTTLLLSTFALLLGCTLPFIALIDSEEWLNTAILCIWFMYNICQVAGFCLVLSIPRYCFQQMRYSLSSFHDNIVSDDTVIRFIGNYDELIGICNEIDSHFGLRNTSNIVFAFGTLVLQTFLLIESYVILLENSETVWIALVAYIVILVGILALFIFGCSSVESEAEKFHEVLSSLVMRDKSASLVTNPHVMAHFAIGKKLKFSACGCFYIDYRLGYSMLAGFITYVVILVEFDRNRTPAIDSFKPVPTFSN